MSSPPLSRCGNRGIDSRFHAIAAGRKKENTLPVTRRRLKDGNEENATKALLKPKLHRRHFSWEHNRECIARGAGIGTERKGGKQYTGRIPRRAGLIKQEGGAPYTTGIKMAAGLTLRLLGSTLAL